MSELLLINAILLFIFVSFYLSFTFSQEISKRDTFYGIYLEEKYQHDPALKVISKHFKLQSLLIFLTVSTATLLYINVQKATENPLSILLPMTVQLVLYFTVYIKTFNKVKAFKKKHGVSTPTHLKTVIDTEFIKEKNSLKKIFISLYTVPLLVTLGLMLYTFYNYSSLPSKIPTHWNYLGKIDAWSPKSYGSVLFPSIMQFCTIILLAFVTLNIFTSRIKLNTNDIQKSKTNALKYLSGIASSLYLIMLFIVVTFWGTTLPGLQGSDLNAYSLWISLLGPLIGVIVMLYTYIRYGDKTSSKDKSNDSYSPEDDDAFWLWGFLYNNPNDPAVMVQKRYGLGWTLNIGNKMGKFILVILLVFILGSLVMPLFFN